MLILDHAGLGRKRWKRWRPSVALTLQAQLRFQEFLLLYLPGDEELAQLTQKDIVEASPDTQVTLYLLNCQDPWDFEQVYSALHDFAQGQSFDQELNHYFIHITTGTHVAQICLYLLTEAHYLPGKLIQSSPDKAQPIQGTYHIIDLDLSRYDQIASQFAQESRDAVSYLKGGIATRNKTFNALIQELEQVSIKSTAPILLTGPTGAGKSQLAKRIYELKCQRAQVSGKLVEVNCATLRGDSAMSALFGHVKGAFTGALSPRSGLLREADKGLLFLDEIAELGLDEQAMLLRAIEEKTFLPMGGDASVNSDFQLIAGTHRDLYAQVRAGLFREDLLARINLWTFNLPSLKERLEDLEPNLEHELQSFMRHARYKVSFNKSAREKYLAFAYSTDALWRANFRDLNSSVIRMATLAEGGRITESVVEAEIARLNSAWQGFLAGSPSAKVDLRRWLSDAQIASLDLFDQQQLATVIEACLASRSLAEAGRKLFNVSRENKTIANDSHRLKQYLQKYDLSFSDLRE